MAWDGNGNVIRDNGTNTGQTVWQDDADASVKIRADRHDNHDQDLANAIENTVALDGQNTTTTGNSILHFDTGSNKFSGLSIGVNEFVARQSGNLIGVGVAASRIVGRKATGDVGALAAEEAQRVLGDDEHATDSGTDAFVSATTTTAPAAGVRIYRDFQSANTTTTPTLDTLTITTRDGSALWAGALSGVHNLQLNAGGTAWLVLDPNPIDEDDMASDSEIAVPTQQSVKAYVDESTPTFVHVVDEKPEGTDGGALSTSYADRDLNTIVFSSVAGVSLAGNRLTLPPGRYRVDASAPATSSNLTDIATHKARLRNNTALTVLNGTSEFVRGESGGTGPAITTRSFVRGVIDILAESEISLQHIVGASGGSIDGGTASSFGDPCIYTEVFLQKLQPVADLNVVSEFTQIEESGDVGAHQGVSFDGAHYYTCGGDGGTGATRTENQLTLFKYDGAFTLADSRDCSSDGPALQWQLAGIYYNSSDDRLYVTANNYQGGNFDAGFTATPAGWVLVYEASNLSFVEYHSLGDNIAEGVWLYDGSWWQVHAGGDGYDGHEIIQWDLSWNQVKTHRLPDEAPEGDLLFWQTVFVIDDVFYLNHHDQSISNPLRSYWYDSEQDRFVPVDANVGKPSSECSQGAYYDGENVYWAKRVAVNDNRVVKSTA